MGAEASSQFTPGADDGVGRESSTRSNISSGAKALTRFSRRSRQTILAKWQSRHLPSQLFGVIRHAERADALYAFFGGQRWSSTEDCHHWPMDPPLSDAGMEAAEEIGHTMHRFAAQRGSEVHVVVSSPYWRCVQTAVEICKVLGPCTRLIVDRSLGEVYGPSVMGQTEPPCPVRPMENNLAYCRSQGVACHPRVIGRWPQWPEDLRDARSRYVLRFLAYLQRSNTTRRNFVLVGHGDCVGAVLATMPPMRDWAVEKVDFGGTLLAERGRARATAKPRANGAAGFSSVLPCTEEEAEPSCLHSLSELEALPEAPGAVAEGAAGPSSKRAPSTRPGGLAPVQLDTWVEETAVAASSSDGTATAPLLEGPKDSDGWKLETHNVTLRRREGAGKFKRRLLSLAKQGPFTQDKIEELLGGLSDQPLGCRGNGEELQRERRSYSISTFLFGASDVASMRDVDGNSEWSEVNSEVTPDEHGNPGKTRDHGQMKNSGSAASSSQAGPRISVKSTSSGEPISWASSEDLREKLRRRSQELNPNMIATLANARGRRLTDGAATITKLFRQVPKVTIDRRCDSILLEDEDAAAAAVAPALEPCPEPSHTRTKRAHTAGPLSVPPPAGKGPGGSALPPSPRSPWLGWRQPGARRPKERSRSSSRARTSSSSSSSSKSVPRTSPRGPRGPRKTKGRRASWSEATTAKALAAEEGLGTPFVARTASAPEGEGEGQPLGGMENSLLMRRRRRQEAIGEAVCAVTCAEGPPCSWTVQPPDVPLLVLQRPYCGGGGAVSSAECAPNAGNSGTGGASEAPAINKFENSLLVRRRHSREAAKPR